MKNKCVITIGGVLDFLREYFPTEKADCRSVIIYKMDEDIADLLKEIGWIEKHPEFKLFYRLLPEGEYILNFWRGI